MNNPKYEHEPVSPPEFRLTESEDYLYEDDILGVIIAKLKEAGLYRPDLLAVGYAPSYDGASDPKRDEMITYAFTVERWEQALKSGNDTDTPTFYAKDSSNDSGEMAIGVYDPDQLKEVWAHQYRHNDGVSVDEAKLATFLIGPKE